MIDVNSLYRTSSDMLMQARYLKSQISQKEFELKLADIKSQYYTDNMRSLQMMVLRKNNIKNEISILTNNMNTHIINAIEAAMQLANIELKSHTVFSMAFIAISSITSFLNLENIYQLSLPFHLQMFISNLYTQNISSEKSLLINELRNLKSLCHIP